jgi:hypothetical protein
MHSGELALLMCDGRRAVQAFYTCQSLGFVRHVSETAQPPVYMVRLATSTAMLFRSVAGGQQRACVGQAACCTEAKSKPFDVWDMLRM